jgi:hypothetical protein
MLTSSEVVVQNTGGSLGVETAQHGRERLDALEPF